MNKRHRRQQRMDWRKLDRCVIDWACSGSGLGSKQRESGNFDPDPDFDMLSASLRVLRGLCVKKSPSASSVSGVREKSGTCPILFGTIFECPICLDYSIAAKRRWSL